jgi:integrase
MSIMTDPITEHIVRAVRQAIREEMPSHVSGSDKRLLTIEQTAIYLGCSPNQVRNLIAAGIIEPFRWPVEQERKKPYFDRMDLDRCIDQIKAQRRRAGRRIKRMARRVSNPTSITGFGCIYKRGNVFWMKYKTRDGSYAQRSTQQRDQTAAFAELMRQAGRRGSGEMDTSSPERVTFDALFSLLEQDYRRRKLSTLADMKARVEKHLRPWFGSIKVLDLRKRDVEQFVAHSLKELEPASVNKLLAYTRRAMKLGADEDPPLVLRIPGWFKKLPEDNVRTGTMTPTQYDALKRAMPAHSALALCIGYHTGIRRGLILDLLWEWVDMEAGVIRIPPKDRSTKKKPRSIPIYGDMRAMLEMAREAAKTAHVIEFDGKRIYSLKRSWSTATKLCKCPTMLFHDLRRTAATNMDAAGISRSRIKECVGWKTDAMFERYRIGSEKAAVETGQTMEAFMEARRVNSDAKERAN